MFHTQLRQLIYTIGLILFLKGCTPLLNAEEARPEVRLRVSPKVQLLPMGSGGTVVISVTISWTPQNRVGCVTVDGPLFRSSCWESLQAGPATQEFRYSGLPAGEYEVMGEVQWVDGEKGERKTTLARDTFVISSGEGEGF